MKNESEKTNDYQENTYKKISKVSLNPMKNNVKKFIALSLTIFLTTLNYFVSSTLFFLCGFQLWVFVPIFGLVTLTLSIVLYRIVKTFLKTTHLNTSISLKEFLTVINKKSMTSTFESGENNGDDLCLACYDNISNITTFPCGHKVMCGTCTWKYISCRFAGYQMLTCVLCRSNVVKMYGEVASNKSALIKHILRWLNNGR